MKRKTNEKMYVKGREGGKSGWMKRRNGWKDSWYKIRDIPIFLDIKLGIDNIGRRKEEKWKELMMDGCNWEKKQMKFSEVSLYKSQFFFLRCCAEWKGQCQSYHLSGQSVYIYKNSYEIIIFILDPRKQIWELDKLVFDWWNICCIKNWFFCCF